MSLAPSKRLSPEAIRDSASHRHQIPTGTGGRRRTARVPYKLTRVALRHRVWLLAAGHMMVFTIAYWLAFALRFDFQIPEEFWGRLIHTLPAVLAIKLAVFYLMGHYHGWWRYVTFSDLASLLRASLLSLVFLVVINHYLLGGHIPRAVVIVDCLVTALLIGSLRASWRLCREYRWLGRRHLRTAMMVGADHLSGLVAHQIHSHPELPFRVVGFLDDDAQRRGTRLGGIPVLGPLEELKHIAISCRATDLLITANRLQGNRLRKLMDACDEAGLQLKIVPSVAQHLNGADSIPVRDVEINDLLHREPIQLDTRAISAEIAGQTILVTGAGGSIGSEICRQLLQFGPRKLVLVDQGENALFLINNELRETPSGTRTEILPIVADVLDDVRMDQVFAASRPDFVVHAAAHKHVGLMEHNVGECVNNNVLGTKCVADLAKRYGAAKFVLISTDKAVNPTSVMGASKQIAERYINAMAQESDTAFIVVRFGNVLGSNGSVVPIFQEQIRRGGPITITDKRMTRFFMTIPEASQLVLQAAAMGQGGEIFVLEMGEQVPIVDLARDLIRLSGIPADAVEITFVGARPGEKLYEELYFDDERALETAHPKVRAAYHRPYTVAEAQSAIDSMYDVIDQPDEVVRRKLKELVPEYELPAAERPSTTVQPPLDLGLGSHPSEPISQSVPD